MASGPARMNYWVEIRAAVRRTSKPHLVPLEDVGLYRGFRSIVAYDDVVATEIRAQGRTANLRGQVVYADTLFMDFDGHDPHAFRAWLLASGLAWEEYNSGNRSVHFHIPLVPVAAPWVTEAMRVWVKAAAPTADCSFYHPGGQYRLPGTYHTKRPGQRKELVAAGEGKALVLPETLAPRATGLMRADSSPEAFLAMLMMRKGEGGRRPWLWQAATVGAEGGMPFEEVLEGLLAWNATLCSPPHDPDTVEKQVISAFQRVGRQ